MGLKVFFPTSSDGLNCPETLATEVQDGPDSPGSAAVRALGQELVQGSPVSLRRAWAVRCLLALSGRGGLGLCPGQPVWLSSQSCNTGCVCPEEKTPQPETALKSTARDWNRLPQPRVSVGGWTCTLWGARKVGCGRHYPAQHLFPSSSSHS